MKIVVTSAAGYAEPTEMEVEPTQRVQDLVRDVAAAQGVSPESIQLMHDGKALEGRQTVKQAGLKDGDTVKAIPHDPKGGLVDPSTNGSTRVAKRMAQIRHARIKNEVHRVKEAGIPLGRLDDLRWRGHVKGADRWKGQKFPFELVLPASYPARPPVVRFLHQPVPTHPNIAQNGGVCHNHLMQDWDVTMNLVTVYEDLEWLMKNPNYASSFHPASAMRVPARRVRRAPPGALSSWFDRILG